MAKWALSRDVFKCYHLVPKADMTYVYSLGSGVYWAIPDSKDASWLATGLPTWHVWDRTNPDLDKLAYDLLSNHLFAWEVDEFPWEKPAPIQWKCYATPQCQGRVNPAGHNCYHCGNPEGSGKW